MNTLQNKSSIPLSIAIKKGLILDVLFEFTTELGTSRTLTRSDIQSHYPHIDNFDSMINALINRQLLVEKLEYDDTHHWQPAKSTGLLRLAHDTLAPIIRKSFFQSKKPAQLSRNLLEQKIFYSENKNTTTLTNKELKQIETGISGMRNLTKLESDYILLSKSKIKARALKYFSLGTVFFLTFIGVIYWNQMTLWKSKGNSMLEKAQSHLDNHAFEKSLLYAASSKFFLKENKKLKETIIKSFINLAIKNPEKLKNKEQLLFLEGDKADVSKNQGFITTYFSEDFEGDVDKQTSCFYRKNKHNNYQKIRKLRGRVWNYFKNDSLILTNLPEKDSSYVYRVLPDREVMLLGGMQGTFRKISPDKNLFLTNGVPKITKGNKSYYHSYIYLIEQTRLKFLKTLIHPIWTISPNNEYIITSDVINPGLILYKINNDYTVDSISVMEGWWGYFSKNSNIILTYPDVSAEKSILYKIHSNNRLKVLRKWEDAKVRLTPYKDKYLVKPINDSLFYYLKILDEYSIDSLEKVRGKSLEFVQDGSMAIFSQAETDTPIAYSTYESGNTSENSSFFNDAGDLEENIDFQGRFLETSENGRFILSVSNNSETAYLIDRQNHITINIPITEFLYNGQLLNAKGILFSDIKNSRAIYLPTNLFLLSSKEMINSIHFNKKLVDSIEQETKADLFNL